MYSKDNKELEKYLKNIAKMLDGNNNNLKYKSMYHFLLEHGQSYGVQEYPEKYNHYKGEMRQCYYNSYQLANSYPNLRYCEGYAYGIIPVAHAWVVDEGGFVIDPTWLDGVAYYGATFSMEYLIRVTFSRGTYGPVIDNYEQRWPLLNGEHQYRDGKVLMEKREE